VVDLEGLCGILERVSYLSEKMREISELDINPVLTSPVGCIAVDARFIFMG
jgi:hypothetical protein